CDPGPAEAHGGDLAYDRSRDPAHRYSAARHRLDASVEFVLAAYLKRAEKTRPHALARGAGQTARAEFAALHRPRWAHRRHHRPHVGYGHSSLRVRRRRAFMGDVVARSGAAFDVAFFGGRIDLGAAHQPAARALRDDDLTVGSVPPTGHVGIRRSEGALCRSRMARAAHRRLQ